MKRSPLLTCAASVLSTCLAHGSPFSALWQLGSDDGQSSPFSQENFSANAAPGNASSKDDDYYLAGTYPAPIGTLGANEDIANFERAVTSSDPRDRVHFQLDAAQASASSRLRVTIDFFGGGASGISGFASHNVVLRLNGTTIATRNAVTWDSTLIITVPASSVSAATGANTLEIERTGGTASGWVQIDYVKFEADALGIQDADSDGMPRWFEDAYGLSESDPGDAALDADGDGRTNFQEFQAGTNPTDPDSDNDGITDSAELLSGTNPLLEDTDGDGITDGKETASSPLLADTDADGFPDNIEMEQGTNPSNALSKPFDFPGAVSLQFVCQQQVSAILPSGEPAGFFRLPNWNASAPLPNWTGNGVVSTGSGTNLRNHRGQATTLSASWSYHYASSGFHIGKSDERLLNGMIETEISAGTSATVQLTGIPYATYDILVYTGYKYPGRRGVIRLDSDAATNRYFVSDTAPPFIRWKEITASSEPQIAPGNFVRFRNLSGSSHSITLQALSPDVVGIHGLQVIDTGTDSDSDGMSDAAEIEYRFNPALADAVADADADGMTNAAEIAAGSDPNHSDTDRDGLADGTEAGHGTSPLDPDSDNDGLTDGAEVNASIFPSSPILADTDSDGFGDFVEKQNGSNPNSSASIPPPIPVWDPGTRTWRWRIDNLQVLWDHDHSMLGAINGDETMIVEAIADINQSGWRRQIGIGIRFVGGKLVHRFRGVEGAFHVSGNTNSGFWDSDWNSSPTDRTRDFGFSGYGKADGSKVLRFEFTATQPDSAVNLWTLGFVIADFSNPGAPVTLASRSWANAVAADPSLLDGTAVWKNNEGETGAIQIYTETGVGAYISPTLLGTPDADDDGMPDSWETTHSFNPSNPADAPLDADSDGLGNLREFLTGTDPRDSDSDDDGAADGVELLHGSNPLAAGNTPTWFAFNGSIDDLDGDGLSDSWLLWSGGDARVPSADDDGDGMSNLDESKAGTDPDDASSRFDLSSWRSGNDLVLSWTDLPFKAHQPEFSSSLGGWQNLGGTAVSAAGRRQLTLPSLFPAAPPANFYRAGVKPVDTDSDGVEDWVESKVLGSSISSPNSMGQAITRMNGQNLSGDANALLNRLQGASPSGGPPGTGAAGTPSPVQASRFLMQATFGPTPEAIAELRSLGYAAWIAQQRALPPSLLQPYIRAIKADGAGPRTDRTYNFNEMDKFVFGNNVTTPFARNAVAGKDQLRQRMAFALSQILVVSRRDANLEEKPEGMANYYDTLSRNALGNFGKLLEEVTFHPAMGWYLSSAGNQKADPSIPRYPDENYAREIMQLFTIGLWKLNPDGSRKTDTSGEPIPTYDNGDITEMARVFTGMYFASPYGWGGGGWADDHITLPMVMYPERHDFGFKHLPNGFVIPEREPSEANGKRDILDAVGALFNHPNTPPFICRQLIQFLVTDNPSPAYIRRVQDVFVNDGSGVRGNLGAVAQAILLDPEARGLPISGSSGKVREPVIRTMHLGRMFRLAESYPDFVWWNWTDNFYANSLQEPMNSPSVFNFYTPVYQAPGEIRNGGLVSPGFQIVNTFSAVSFPNLLWDYLHDGFKSAWDWEYPLDYSRTLLLAENPNALIDHIDLLVCAGNLTARTRGIMLGALSNPSLSRKERVATAIWTAMNSPEGAVQR